MTMFILTTRLPIYFYWICKIWSYLGGNLIYFSEKIEEDLDISSLLIQFYIKSFRPKKIILSKKINGYVQLKSIMKENYQIEIF